jgi:hypothetical protein
MTNDPTQLESTPHFCRICGEFGIVLAGFICDLCENYTKNSSQINASEHTAESLAKLVEDIMNS